MRVVHGFMDDLSHEMRQRLYKPLNQDKGYSYLDTVEEITHGDGKKEKDNVKKHIQCSAAPRSQLKLAMMGSVPYLQSLVPCKYA